MTTEPHTAAQETTTGDADSWRTLEDARNWIARMDREHGHRDEELRTLIAFLTLDESRPVQVLELGAGHGLLTRGVLERFPLASVMALDLNPAMIEEGKQRLAPFGSRVKYEQCDLAAPASKTSRCSGNARG